MIKNLLVAFTTFVLLTKVCFAEVDSTTILNYHNEKRQLVASGNQDGQPSATNMVEFVWDSELATLAQNWANTNPGGHNPDRNTASYQGAGENLYKSWGSAEFDPKKGIDAWYNEVQQFDSSEISNYSFSGGTGHYTQLVWAETTKVGCGVFTQDDDNYGKANVMICNYYPAGNFIGNSIYKTGTAASECSNGVSSNFNALCANA